MYNNANTIVNPICLLTLLLQWLKNNFIGYLDAWEKSVNERPGFEKIEKKNKMLLSQETRLGLRMTGNSIIICITNLSVLLLSFLLTAVLSFCKLLEYVFTIPDVTVFLSSRICQDPLENLFGHQRQRGRVNENPNLAEFIKKTQALRVVNSTCASVQGNYRGTCKDKKSFDLNNTPLNKKRKH